MPAMAPTSKNHRPGRPRVHDRATAARVTYTITGEIRDAIKLLRMKTNARDDSQALIDHLAATLKRELDEVRSLRKSRAG
jgi:hypothetical protein